MAGLLFTDTQIQQLATFFAGLTCKEDCTIYREFDVEDNSGGHSKSYSPVETVKCAVTDDLRPAERILAQQSNFDVIKIILLPLKTDVRYATDRLKVKGVTYHIIAEFTQTYDVLRRVPVAPMPLGVSV